MPVPLRQVLALAKKFPQELRCIELQKISSFTNTRDIHHIFKEDAKHIQRAIRMYHPIKMNPANQWIVTFDTIQSARHCLNKYTLNYTLGSELGHSSLVPCSRLEAYNTINLLMRNPENCVFFVGMPPGTSTISTLLPGFEPCPSDVVEPTITFRYSTLISNNHYFFVDPIPNFSEKGDTCIVEFGSKESAHRAVSLAFDLNNVDCPNQKEKGLAINRINPYFMA